MKKTGNWSRDFDDNKDDLYERGIKREIDENKKLLSKDKNFDSATLKLLNMIDDLYKKLRIVNSSYYKEEEHLEIMSIIDTIEKKLKKISKEEADKIEHDKEAERAGWDECREEEEANDRWEEEHE